MTGGAKNAKIFLVGAGRMGGALLRGWLAAGFPPRFLSVKEPNPAPDLAAALKERNISEAPEGPPDALVLAVKPQIMTPVLAEIRGYVGPATVILSIAAGRTVDSIAVHVPPQTAVVRAMPNLPAEVGRGITALYANDHVKPAQKQLCEALLAAVGQTGWIEDESLMDAITAVSGSGPAYVFYLTECLAHAAREAGLPEELACKFARATVTGAGELLYRSSLSAAQLRENVTSPGGTTAAGLSKLMGDGGLKELLSATVRAAASRSRELSR